MFILQENKWDKELIIVMMCEAAFTSYIFLPSTSLMLLFTWSSNLGTQWYPRNLMKSQRKRWENPSLKQTSLMPQEDSGFTAAEWGYFMPHPQEEFWESPWPSIPTRHLWFALLSVGVNVNVLWEEGKSGHLFVGRDDWSVGISIKISNWLSKQITAKEHWPL